LYRDGCTVHQRGRQHQWHLDFGELKIISGEHFIELIKFSAVTIPSPSFLSAAYGRRPPHRVKPNRDVDYAKTAAGLRRVVSIR
jgi:hypothetical protein